MTRLIDLVVSHIDKAELETLLKQLKAMDHELDQKMEDVRSAQQNVTTWDRINVFTHSDSELDLKEENRVYQEVRDQHGLVVARIKDLIRTAMYSDFSIRLKIHPAELLKSVTALRVQHKWGIGGKAHEYQIAGLTGVRERIGQLTALIDDHYDFPKHPLDADELLNIVYDDILRKGGFIK